MVYRFFDRKTSGGAIKKKKRKQSNKELAEELPKPVIENLRTEKYTHLS